MIIDTQTAINDAINSVAPNVVGGGKKFRGPNATADLVYQVWIAKALMMTDMLPQMVEEARTINLSRRDYLEKYGKRGKYTGSTGWSKDGEFKWRFELPKQLMFYFRKVVGPFISTDHDELDDPDSKFWKMMESIIMDTTPDRLIKLQKGIRRKLLKESKKRVQVGHGSDNQNPSKA